MEDLSKLQEQLNAFENSHKLWTSGPFQVWKKETEALLAAIEKALMMNSWEHKELRGHLAMMGLSAPKSHDDELRLYIALKAVLGFERRKLSLLETQSGNYEKTKRKILELGRNGDIGDTRSVPAR